MSVTQKIKTPNKEIIQPKKMGLLVENPVYKPFRYPWCYDAWLTQQRIHWLPEEVPLGDDVRDWQKKPNSIRKKFINSNIQIFHSS
jgi:ribonucleoside-diphosphate reductase beta chain